MESFSYLDWVKVIQLGPTLCTTMDFTIQGIIYSRIMEWVDFPFSRGSSQPRNQTQSPTLQADYLLAEPQGKLFGELIKRMLIKRPTENFLSLLIKDVW